MAIIYEKFNPTNSLKRMTEDWVRKVELLGAKNLELMLWIEPFPTEGPITFSDQYFPEQVNDQKKLDDNYVLDLPELNVNQRRWKKCQLKYEIENPKLNTENLKFDTGFQALVGWDETLKGLFNTSLDKTIRAMNFYQIPINYFRTIASARE